MMNSQRYATGGGSFRRQSFAFSLLLCGALFMAAGCARQPKANVLVKVGTREITIEDFEQEVQWRVKSRWPLPDKQDLLEQMIARELRVQTARALGLEQDPDVRRRYEAMLAGRVEDLQLKPALEGLAVTPEEIQAAYEKEISRYSRPAKARLALIQIKTDRRMSPEKLAEAEARMAEARKAALALPPAVQGFGAVAVDYSEDQASRYRGGDVGWFDQGRSEYRWPREVVAAGFALAKNHDFSPVIKVSDGFYLVSRLDTREPVVTPLAQVRSSIERRLLAEKRQQTESAFYAKMRASAPVETLTQALARVEYPSTTVAKAREQLPPSSPISQ